MKTCITCKQEKELSEFPKRVGSKDGTRGECKTCYNQRQTKFAKKLGYKHQNLYNKERSLTGWKQIIDPIKDKNRHLLYTYKITIDQYNQILIKQNNKCNILLGFAEDNITILNNAINYLENQYVL